MSYQEQFTPEEWQALVAAPFQATLAIVSADPGGLVAGAKEGSALAHLLRDGDGAGGLVDEVARDAISDRPSRKDLGIERQTKDQALEAAVEAMRGAVAVVESKAPDQADAFRTWLYSISERVASAGKEGTFLGFGGERVSDDERAALERIRGALGL
jgi:hypothetical protein